VRLLLDSHALIWWLDGAERLSPAARAAIANPASTVYVSAASAWEIAIKAAKGKIRLPAPLSEGVRLSGFAELAVSIAHAEQAAALPPRHGDPFDRLLAAQALAESLTLVTRDAQLGAYGAAILAA
jgi:PIN domain nuclease of toxin-antitoxin system